MITLSQQALAFSATPQMQLETEKERVSLLETLLQTQKELADASQQLERLRQDMKVQQLREQVWRVVLGVHSPIQQLIVLWHFLCTKYCAMC